MILERPEDEILMSCALRFDGYRYWDARRADAPDGLTALGDLVRFVVERREFFADPSDNLAAFFALQRFLGKWGGESLSAHSDEHVVYRLLFLHLYREEISPEFRLADYFERWERDFRPHREALAARIRRTLARRR